MELTNAGGRRRLTAQWVACALFGCVSVASASAAQASTTAFTTTGEHAFVVPAGVTSVHVVAIGGRGGTSSGGPAGGLGAVASADLAVTSGQVLYAEVAGNGGDGSTTNGGMTGFAGGPGGFNGGGAGGKACGGTTAGAGGGGGASDVRTSARGSGDPDPSLGARVVSAAGGGGSGGGGSSAPGGGSGGPAGAAGSTGGGTSGGTGGGAAGSSAGGTGGTGSGGAGGGALGNGGGGAADSSGCGPGGAVGYGGGGGGGGLYGGGGGGGGFGSGGGGGGGGSTGFGSGATSTSIAPDTTGTPSVTFTYTVPSPTISITFPASGASYAQGQVVNANYSCTAAAGTTLSSCTGPVANGAAIDTTTAGQHTFTVNAQDADGGSATQSVSYTVLAGPAPTLAPSISGVSQAAKIWRASDAPAHISATRNPPVGTTFSFALNQPASATLTFTQRTAGRKVNGKCVAQSSKNRRNARCTRTIVAGTLSFGAHQGTNRVRFAGRISKAKKLRPGRYTLRITATNSQGQRAAPKSLSFTIVK
jgi:hypothetical protein